ncbi:UbiA family prenyltransferase [Roseibacillus persicicus]|uniref:UbiA family prenyltransferase n=1 Tax=Roseibacillus persicicus TaxID=454148 RepID=UPI00280C7549|nr:UbiA family prenyltransferase [Roseibacillus persicicus]MDQ8189339.1 UbiA family prenyltransferase [Roseibacillus persicicus]
MRKQTIIDLLAAGRVANLPSVVSNVLLGCGLGMFLRNFGQDPVFLFPCLAGCFLYVGGCFYNDWADRKWDAENRPERAIPSQRLKPLAMLLASLALMCLGVVCAFVVGTEALFVAGWIVASILVYTWIHKKTAWGVLPMGLCRALLYPLGFVSQKWDPNLWSNHFQILGLRQGAEGKEELAPKGMSYDSEVWFQTQTVSIFAIGLLLYVAGLSLFARAESKPVVPQLNRVLGILFMSLVVIGHSHFLIFEFPAWSALSLVPFLVLLIAGILAMKKSVGKGVSLLLANICLVDFIFALPLAIGFMQWDFALTTSQALVFPLVSFGGFLLALLLQKIAPAT